MAATLQTRGDVVTGQTAGPRGFWQSETLAGKIVDLALPWIHHRVPGAAALTSNYASATVSSVEEPALGIVALCGVCGLLALGLASLIGRRVTSSTALIGLLTVLTLTSISFYTRGGLGALAAVIVTPSIRTWSRFVVVIALLGLLAAGLALTWLEARRGRIVALLAAGSVLVVGVLDQTNPAVAPDYPALRATSGEMATYASSLEGPRAWLLRLPAPGCAVPGTGSDAGDDGLRPAAAVRRLIRTEVELWRDAWHRAADWQLALPSVGEAPWSTISRPRASAPSRWTLAV